MLIFGPFQQELLSPKLFNLDQIAESGRREQSNLCSSGGLAIFAPIRAACLIARQLCARNFCAAWTFVCVQLSAWKT
jgi:UDP-N-acetylmuramyl pentapeptide phosphotransferase/UDP-N-acetylglucosamine-1-phosphate transferase